MTISAALTPSEQRAREVAEGVDGAVHVLLGVRVIALEFRHDLRQRKPKVPEKIKKKKCQPRLNERTRVEHKATHTLVSSQELATSSGSEGHVNSTTGRLSKQRLKRQPDLTCNAAVRTQDESKTLQIGPYGHTNSKDNAAVFGRKQRKKTEGKPLKFQIRKRCAIALQHC